MIEMLNTKKGAYFAGGSAFLGIGLVLDHLAFPLSLYALGIAIFLLGYPIAKDVCLEMVKTRDMQVDFLMIVSAVGAMLIGSFHEAAILLFIFAGSEVLEEYVFRKSIKTMESLMNQLPKQATVVREDGSTEILALHEIQQGEMILVKKGEQISLDGRARQAMLVNESLLTGESIPVNKEVGDSVFAGTVNIGEASSYEVTKRNEESVFSHILELVQQATETKSKRDQAIHQMQKTYVIGVLATVLVFILALITFQELSFTQAFYRGMILLTVASPCALIASITPAMLSSMSFGAKNGILIKNADALENMMKLSVLCSDKTGTLTRGEFEVHDYHLDIPDLLPLICYMESQSSHPLARAILVRFTEEAIRYQGIMAPVQEIAGQGLSMGEVSVGNHALVKGCFDPNGYLKKDSQGTLLFVAQSQILVGYIELVDTIRPDAKEMVRDFLQRGVKMVMLTGDREKSAAFAAQQLQIDSYHAACMPEDKLSYLKKEKTGKAVVGMIGDGINDAPILANADISIAMGGGTDIAMDVSDVIITQNHLAKISLLYHLSQKYGSITRSNIIFSIAVILILIVLNILGLLDLTQGVFFHETSTILVILNGLRLLNFKQ
ncbi:heavy metal translocating P-type ATPase [Streptococcus himalayensis]|uniref:ATPase n=1 Tax=Streptococcus himalayensis TaxID=1888195 RepID=A0A917A7A0_9STRE|nr:heavy metal translocating P-type ATPase [Streptococcus himalayensis]GGE31978.1 ATPase [Streptococcus himalayensis]